MLNEHAKLLALLKQTGEVVGRKKLQKIVFIAQKMQLPFREKFQFHMFGPYSEELSLRMEEMCQLDFISEVKESKASYQQYRYQLLDKGEQFLSMMASGTELPKATEMLNQLNDRSSKFLELVSTVLYFQELSKEEVTNKVFKLKPTQNYSLTDIEDAYTFIAQLRG